MTLELAPRIAPAGVAGSVSRSPARHARPPDQPATPLELYERGLAEGLLFQRGEDGRLRELPVGRWLGGTRGADGRVLERARGPVLDVGCGPGRHVLALARRGVLALGVDIAPAAVRRARDRGAAAMLGSVFESVPGEPGWRTALLLDGNVGIAGRPVALLARLSELLAPGGKVICELEAPGQPTRGELVALEDAAGTRSSWFAWARVGVDGLAPLAAQAGMEVSAIWSDEQRWFGALEARREPIPVAR
jgi:SAM-dependent methyltransferase